MRRLFLLLTLSVIAFTSCEKLFNNEPEKTTFTITKNSVYNVISLGADIAVNYKITKPIEGVTVSATTSEDWITETKALKNAVVFTVAKNESDIARTATITLTYSDFVHTVTITQSAAGAELSEYTEFEHLSGFYLGTHDGATDKDHHYSLIMGESGNCIDLATGDLNLEKGKHYLFFDLYSSTMPEKLNREFSIPVGNYVLDHANSATAGTISELPTYLYREDGKSGITTEFVNGSITVTEECIYANFVDKNGKEYKYCCTTPWVDNITNFGSFYPAKNLSTLEGDRKVEFGEVDAYASTSGDKYLISKNYWNIFIIDNSTGHCFDFVLLSDICDSIPTGLFPISADLSKESIVLPGYANCENIPVWSWYTHYTNDRDIISSAPIVGGEISIEDNGDNTHTISVDVVDDLGNKLTGVCIAPFKTY